MSKAKSLEEFTQEEKEQIFLSLYNIATSFLEEVEDIDDIGADADLRQDFRDDLEDLAIDYFKK